MRRRFAPLSPLVVLVPLGIAAGAAAGWAARRTLRRRVVYAGVARARAQAGFVRHEADVAGRPTVWLERPAATTPPEATVVLVHGFNGGKDVWLRYAPHTPPGWRLLAPDMPGHGESDAFPAPGGHTAYDPALLARALAEWLDAVAPGERVHLAGSSLGGEVVARVALAHPARVASLALFCPAGVAPEAPSDMDRLAEAGDYVLIPTDREALDRLYAHVFVRPPHVPAIARTVFAADAAAREPFMRELLAAIGEARDALRDEIPRLAMPTLVLWGAEDRILHPSCFDAWCAALPEGALTEVLADVGHAPMMEAPAETATHHARLVAGAADAS